jgi:hypothetical protein
MKTTNKEVTVVMTVQVTKIVKVLTDDEAIVNAAVEKTKKDLMKKIKNASDDAIILKEKVFPNLEG